MHNFLKSNKHMVAFLGIAFSLIIIVTFGVAVVLLGDDSPLFADSSSVGSQSSSDTSGSTGSSETMDTGEEIKPPVDEYPPELWEELPETGSKTELFNRPDEMRAVFLNAGEEFLGGQNRSESAVYKEIDDAIAKALDMSMNTIVFNIYNEKGVAYPSKWLPQLATAFDPLNYAIKKARANGLYIYAIYPLLVEPTENGLASVKVISPLVLDNCRKELLAFSKTYHVDGILFDKYYNIESENSYQNYLVNGGGMGYEEYMMSVTRTLIETSSKLIRTYTPGVQVGLLTDSVWANKTEHAEGSNTAADFSMLVDGNADIKAWMNRNLLDFVMVKNYGSLSNGTEPFAVVAKWWANFADERNIPMYMVHASNRICSEYKGWASADEITKQVIEARKLKGYSGSAFNSLQSLLQDKNGAATLLIKYYKDEVSSDFILAELEMAKPAKYTYETFESVVTFQGATHPEVPVTINDVTIEKSKNGYFSLTKELKPGLNTFVIKSKNKVFTYKITRKVKVIQSVTPTGNLTVDGGMEITVSVEAYKDSEVTATLAGETITLEETTTGDDNTHRESTYVRYEGRFTAPSGTSSVQKLGTISIKGSYESFTETAKGANIKVNKKAEIGSGAPVRVADTQAETFPSSTLDDYSSPDCYPLPKGALDYTLGDEIIYSQGNTTYRYYMLESGRRVYSKSVESTQNRAEGNVIQGMSISNDGKFTDVVLSMKQNVSFTPSYTSQGMNFQFHYTDKVPDGIPKLTKNPMFSSAVWSGTTLKLTFRVSNGFMGYRAFYNESNHTLTLRFNNIPSSLSGARVTIDPGHGRVDPGALGYISGKHESYISTQVSKKLEASLRNAGASVWRVNTDVDHKVFMGTRMQVAEDSDSHIFISIHCNSALNTAATGHEVYYFYPFSKSLATYVNAGIGRAISVDRGARYGLYYVTRTARYSSVLAELGFVSNYDEYTRLLNSSVQQTLVNGVVSSLQSYISSLYPGDYPKGTETAGEVKLVAVSSVTLDKAEQALKIGEAATLVATVSPEDATNKTVMWSSSDDAIATVNENGQVTAKSVGKATITATTQDGNKTSVCTITVTAIAGEVTMIIFPEGSYTMNKGEIVKPEVEIRPAGINRPELIWTSSNQTVVTVSADGTITAVGGGKARVTAAVKGKETISDFCDITVKDSSLAITEVVLDKTELKLAVNERYTLKPILKPESATDKTLTWSSSDATIAVVTQIGLVVGKKDGVATITAKANNGGVVATCKVIVGNGGEIQATLVTVDATSVTLLIGEEKTINSTVSPQTATNKAVTWISNNTEVVTVDENGKMMAKGAGNATVTVALTSNFGIKAQVEVTVKAPEPPPPTPPIPPTPPPVPEPEPPPPPTPTPTPTTPTPEPTPPDMSSDSTTKPPTSSSATPPESSSNSAALPETTGAAT